MMDQKQIEAAARAMHDGPLGADEHDFDAPENAKSRAWCMDMARAALQTVEPVKVKPLEWRETEDERGDGTSDHDGGYEADAAFDSVYMIQMDFGTDSYVWTVQHDFEVGIIGCYDDPDTAKAAAQAHYEACILSALVQE